MGNMGQAYRKNLVDQVKALVKDVDNLAEDLVGDSDLITNFEIHLKFPPDALPTIELVREHIGSRSLDLLSTLREE